MPDDPDVPGPNPAQVARAIAHEVGRLGPGDLAALRRTGGAGAAFWRIKARCGFGDGPDWAAVVQALAILTPKGLAEGRAPLNNRSRPWGAVLCDGGDPGWRPEGQPPRPRLLSEGRLAQLMAARGEGRRVLMLRAARAVAARRTDPAVDVASVAWSILAPDHPEYLAEAYYRRLDAPHHAREDADVA